MNFDQETIARLENMTQPMFCNISIQGKEDISDLLSAYKETGRALDGLVHDTHFLLEGVSAEKYIEVARTEVKPIAIDLYCGLGGWSEGLLAEGYDVTGYDIEAHDYGTGSYPGILVLRDVRSIHGSELKHASLIVGSSPCQEFSYRAMPWSRAKALPPPYLGMELFNAQFRIQREASEAAGHHIPMIVENVRGAQKWVGRAAWHYGSFYLWGDVPALMPNTLGPSKSKVNSCKRLPGANGALPDGTKQGGDWFGKGCESSMSRLYGSKSSKRKAASAMIAKIPFPLAQHVARAYFPVYEYSRG